MTDKPTNLPAPISNDLSREEQQFVIGMLRQNGNFAKAHGCVEGTGITNPDEHFYKALVMWQNPKVQEEYARLSEKLASREGPLFLGVALAMHDIAVSPAMAPDVRVKAANALFKAAGEKQEIKQVAEVGDNLAAVMRKIKATKDADVLEAHYERVEDD